MEFHLSSVLREMECGQTMFPANAFGPCAGRMFPVGETAQGCGVAPAAGHFLDFYAQ
jgi:hypothetical protein